MSDSSYNGWTNRATWAINLWFNPETREDVHAAREAFEDACADPALPDFLRDFIDTDINWRELEEACSGADDDADDDDDDADA